MFKLVLEKAEEPEIKLPTSTAATAAKSLQSCPTLCDPIDGNPPGSSAYGIFQARVLEWGAIAFSNKLTVNDPTFEVRKHRENSGKKS